MLFMLMSFDYDTSTHTEHLSLNQRSVYFIRWSRSELGFRFVQHRAPSSYGKCRLLTEKVAWHPEPLQGFFFFFPLFR